MCVMVRVTDIDHKGKKKRDRIFIFSLCIVFLQTPAHNNVCFCFSTSLSSGKAMRKSSHLLDDCLMGAVVFTQQDPAGVLGGIVLIQPVQQGHM